MVLEGVVSNPQLQHMTLAFDNCDLGAAAVPVFQSLAPKLSAITSINLSDNGSRLCRYDCVDISAEFTDEEAALVVQALALQPNIKSLLINHASRRPGPATIGVLEARLRSPHCV